MTKTILTPLDKKLIAIAANICWKWGEYKGDMVCQDWEGETGVLDALTNKEKDAMSKLFEDYNSNGQDYEPGYFPYDGMFVSWVVARCLEVMAGIADN